MVNLPVCILYKAPDYSGALFIVLYISYLIFFMVLWGYIFLTLKKAF